ncbi:hypothetical protein EOPP23_03655 [Endozoicomonas sp. OPT23]|uniref:hypothetical protein n=1 Tax=Endozoicomonas sp. OPT23 TaxID=2072845 RepID=UPI00129AC002|nr:hypothetical protein [Endozoicomonas sp. OPT23]MRI32096.1 hypothetical protein [Endozoicomonas sp. OPT23]
MDIKGPTPASSGPSGKPNNEPPKKSRYKGRCISARFYNLKNALRPAGKHPKKPIEEFHILSKEDADQASLDIVEADQIAQKRAINSLAKKLAFKGRLVPEDPKFRSTYSTVKRVLTETPAHSEDNSTIAAQIKTDKDRNRLFKLKVRLPSQTLETSSDIASVLAKTATELAPKNPEALTLQLSHYCTQIGFGKLFELVVVACQDALSPGDTCALAKEHTRRCILSCKGENIEVQLICHSNTLRVFPAFDDPVELPNSVTVTALINVPINKPEQCSLEKVTLHISKPASDL